jgi:hypothetical protein
VGERWIEAAVIYRLLARLVVAIHVAYVAFVVFGGLLVVRGPSLMWVHIVAVVWAFATLAFDCGCPVTPLEKILWRLGGVEPYAEGFVQHHILGWRFSPEHSRRNHIILGVLLVLWNVVIYSLILAR